MNLQRKLTLGYLGLILLVIITSFLVYFSLGKNFLVQFYLQEKLTQAKALAGAIDGDIHSNFTQDGAFSDPAYQSYLKYLQDIKLHDKGITYLYTVALGKDQNFVYVLDADKEEDNRIYIESEDFALVYTLKGEDYPEINFKEEIFNKDFVIKTSLGDLAVSLISDKDLWKLYINTTLVFSATKTDPPTITTPVGPLSSLIPEREFPLEGHHLHLTLSEKGNPASLPGSTLVNTPETLALYTQILQEGVDRFFTEPQQDTYGTYFEVAAVIKNSQGGSRGLLLMDVYEAEVRNFQFQFLWMASYGSLPAIFLALLFSILLSRHLVDPISQFSQAAKKIQTGDFSIRIHLRRKDEYDELASAFNDMCTDLDRSHRVLETRAQEMDYQATHDGVTGLENRRAYFLKLEQLISFLERLKDPVTAAVMFLDLDKFKEVNDSLGHAAGDELLLKVGQRLKTAVRNTDSVFRLGGDEFTLIISPLGHTQDASLVASKILEALRNPFDLEGHSVPIGVSIGVAFYPLDGNSASVLTLHADTALYEAKRLGFSPVFFTPAMTDKVKKSARIREDLIQAFVQKEFRLVYQPIVDQEGTLMSAEALMRWDRPGFGPVSPTEFIPILEESSQISQAGLWAIKTVAKQLKIWESMERPSIPISINLSVRQLKDREFRVQFLDTLFNPGFPREGMYFEITETMLAHESDIRALILSYSEKGMSFALDDFGTGYSSLASLSGLPFSYLKIDKHFVDLIPENKKTVSIIQAIIHLAEALNAITVAEGVETREQFELLKSLGCQRFQGYYFSKPVEPQEVHKDYRKT